MAKKTARQLATELAQAEARIASMKHAGDSVVLAFAQLKASYVALVRTAREKNITQELGGTTALMGLARRCSTWSTWPGWKVASSCPSFRSERFSVRW
jgi:hypothetical protein